MWHLTMQLYFSLLWLFHKNFNLKSQNLVATLYLSNATFPFLCDFVLLLWFYISKLQPCV